MTARLDSFRATLARQPGEIKIQDTRRTPLLPPWRVLGKTSPQGMRPWRSLRMAPAPGGHHPQTVFLALLAAFPAASEIGFRRGGIAAAWSADFRTQLGGTTPPSQAVSCPHPMRLLCREAAAAQQTPPKAFGVRMQA